MAPIPRAFPPIPEPEAEGGGAAGGRNYVIGGNVLGVALGIVTVVALVWALVVALRADNTPEALSARAVSNRSSSGAGTNAAFDTNTSAGGTSTDAASGDTSAASASGTDAAGTATGDAGGAAGGGSGGDAAGGAFRFAPAVGTYAATGTGSRKSTPPGNATAVANPSLEVTGAGAGCFDFKFSVDAGNWNLVTLCGTNDGGIVMPESSQYIRTVLVGTVAEESTENLACAPPDVMLPANPAPGVSGAVGTCMGSNSSSKVPGRHKETAKSTVVGKETVAGVEAWHTRREISMEPGDSQNTQRGTIVEDYWYSTTNGLVLRWKQNVNVTTTVAGVMNVVFTQQSDIALTSPNPG